MTTKKQSTKKGGTKGKAEGSNKGIRLSDPRNTERIYKLLRSDESTSADPLCLSDEINELLNHASAAVEDVPEVFASLFRLAATRVERKSGSATARAAGHYETLQSVLARLDAGETLDDIREATRREWEMKDAARSNKPFSQAEQFKRDAHAYAQKAYNDALAHFEATEGKAAAPFFYEPLESGPQEFEGYREDGLFFAGILASKDCPEQFRDLFSATFGDMLGHASKTFSYSFVLPLMYAVVRDICDAQNYCGTAEGLHNALIYAVEAFVPEELANAARASLKKE
jgi:predicted GIY-YIG superfamily endonuclease